MKNILIPLWLMALIFFAARPVSAQSNIIRITPLSKYQFKVQNVSGIPVGIYFTGYDPEFLDAGAEMTINTDRINKATTLKIIYNEDVHKFVNMSILKKMTVLMGADAARAEVTKLFLKSERSTVINKYIDPATGWAYYKKETESLSDNLWGKFLVTLLSIQAKRSLETKKAEYKRLLVKSEEFLQGAQEGKGQYKDAFKAFPIYGLAKGHKGLSPVLGLDLYWVSTHSNPLSTSFWTKPDVEQGQGGGATLSFLLSPEARTKIGGEDVFLRLHGFADIRTNSYGLRSLGNLGRYFIEGQYVNDDAQEYYAFQNIQGVSMNLNRASVGAFVRASIYPRAFVDLGAGVNIWQSGTLRFNSDLNNTSAQGYLLQSYEARLSQTVIRNQLDAEGFGTYGTYGVARLGINLSNIEEGRHYKGFYLHLTFYAHQNRADPGDDFALSWRNNNFLEQQPVNLSPPEAPLQLGLNIGIGYTF